LIRQRCSTSRSKRIHEYKRQLLNILETIALYQAMKDDPQARLGAAREKSSPARRPASYRYAKLIIKLIKRRSPKIVNNDPAHRRTPEDRLPSPTTMSASPKGDHPRRPTSPNRFSTAGMESPPAPAT